MNEKYRQLAERHGALKVRIDAQRRQLAMHMVPVEAGLARGDAVLRGVDWLKHHPAAVFAAVAGAAILKPRRAWRWLQRGFFVWRGWSKLRASLFGER